MTSDSGQVLQILGGVQATLTVVQAQLEKRAEEDKEVREKMHRADLKRVERDARVDTMLKDMGEQLAALDNRLRLTETGPQTPKPSVSSSRIMKVDTRKAGIIATIITGLAAGIAALFGK